MMKLRYPGSRQGAWRAMAVIAAAPFAIALVWGATRGHLPDQIPQYPAFIRSLASPEEPNDVVAAAVSLAVVEVLIVATMFVLGFRAGRYEWLNYAAIFVWINAAMAIGTLLGSVGASTYEAAADRWWSWYCTLAITIPVTVLVARFVRVHGPTTSPHALPQSSIELRPSERAVFTGKASNRVTLALGLAVAAFGVVLTSVSPAFTALVLFGVVWANGSAIRVMIDSSGVSVRTRWTPWQVRHLELVTIASAEESRHLNGWQEFRLIDTGKSQPGETQIRIRAGSALNLLLHDDTSCSISLDRADQAADMVNALILRARTSVERSDAHVAMATPESDL